LRTPLTSEEVQQCPRHVAFIDCAERPHCSTGVCGSQDGLRSVNAILFVLPSPSSALPPSCSCGRAGRS